MTPPRRPGPLRLVVVADARVPFACVVADAVLARAAGRDDVEGIAVVDAGLAPAGRGAARMRGDAIVRWAFQPSHGLERDAAALRTLAATCRRRGVPLVVPPGRDVNDPAFVERVRGELRPDAALSVSCIQLFGPPLLEALGHPVNLHDGLLPGYRGVDATGWSIYRGERVSGLTFHLMTERVDAGPILLDDAVPVGADAACRAVYRAKRRLAVARLDDALDALVAADRGRPQPAGPSRLFTLADRAAIRRVPDPGEVTWAELERRIRAFGSIDLGLGAVRGATRLRRLDRGRPRHPALAFTTRDGVRGEPDRLRGLPVTLARLRRRAR